MSCFKSYHPVVARDRDSDLLILPLETERRARPTFATQDILHTGWAELGRQLEHGILDILLNS